MGITRDQLLEECQKEAPNCTRCGGTGKISIGGGCMGYDDEVCPICLGKGINTPSLKDVLDEIQTEALKNHPFEPDYGPGCGKCGVDFEEHPNKEVQFGSPSKYSSDGYMLNCPDCGASLCPQEEYHDCRYRGWQ